MTSNGQKKNIEEFLGEAQELTDTLSGTLMDLHRALAEGAPMDPGNINAAFRAIHTLKGLSSLFGVSSMAALSHDLEEVFDGLRMGRLQLDSVYLDLMFEAIELFQLLMNALSENRSMPVPQVESLIKRLHDKATEHLSAQGSLIGEVDLDPEIMGVLTEYEEHRLRENIASDKSLLFVSASFEVTTIDTDLESLKAVLQQHGEILTYLPSSDTEDENRIDLDILLATDAPPETVAREAEATEIAVSIKLVPQKKPSKEAPQPVAPRHSSDDLEELPTTSLRSVTQTVRVDIRRLDNLMNLLGEVNVLFGQVEELHRKMVDEDGMSSSLRQSIRLSRLGKRRLDELQQGILDVRMVPLEQLFDKLSRIVRKMSRHAQKPVEFFVSGADTELDKLIVEELSDPLMHIIRNCIDHGIETPNGRETKGKRREGLVALRAFQKGNHVILEVEDDGAGISKDKVLETAVAKGIVTQEAAKEMGEREILNLIFRPGFSTKHKASTTSGRGVGMDVVKTNLAKLSGLIDIQSKENVGTKFILTLPITLAILRALIVRVSKELYAVPLNSVLEALAIDPGQIQTVEGREVLSLRGSTLPLLRLSQLFDIPEEEQRERQFAIVVGMAQHRVGLVVDELKGQQDIVIKSLGKALSTVPGIAGATELGTQHIVLVLDLAALVNEALATVGGGQLEGNG